MKRPVWKMKRGGLDHAMFLAFMAGWRARRRYQDKVLQPVGPPAEHNEPRTGRDAYDAWRAEVLEHGLHDTSDTVAVH